jgi:large subunit ribosomal protein L13
MAKKESIVRAWYVVDADGEILGKLAVALAKLLMGKNKPIFTPHVDCGDFVVVINAEKVRVTGNKAQDKIYQRYSGYPNGRKVHNFEYMINHKPAHVIREAVRRMLPKNKLGRSMLKKMKVYKGSEHKHEAQQPVKITVKDVK